MAGKSKEKSVPASVARTRPSGGKPGKLKSGSKSADTKKSRAPRRASAQKVAAGAPTATGKAAAKSPASKKTAAKRPVAKKPASKKTTAKKPVAKKPASKKTTAKKPVAKKAVAKKAVAKKAVVKKAVSKKPVSKKAVGRSTPRAESKKVVAASGGKVSRAKKSTPVPRSGGESGAVTAGVKRESVRPSPSAVRRAKEKEKGAVKSPFSHTDHASIFKGVEARKAAARAKQNRMAAVQSKPKKAASRRLTDKQLGDFEQILLRIKAELLRQIAYLRGASLTRADEVNPEEDGTDAFERQLALKLAAGEGDSIFEIDEALERIRQKTYGVCEECACIVPTPRLKALPFARRCVECQSRIEQSPNLSEHRYF